jgi:predicted Zn-dependent protease
LYVNQYRLETIDEYVTMLRFKQPGDFSTNRYPPPLEALQIPSDALSDKRVDDLSLRLRNEGYAFILGHELGHVFKRHYFYQGGGSPEELKRNAAAARSNEEEADAFAIELLRRTSTIPMGAIVFFLASTYYFFPDPGTLSEKEWRNFPDELANHPMSAHRLTALASRLNDAAGSFAGNEKTIQDEQKTVGIIHFIAENLATIAQTLEDTDLYRMMAARAKTADVSSLAPRRHAEQVPGQ